MPVPTSMSGLSETASSNSPQGTENVGTIMNQYLQAAFAFIAQLYAGQLNPQQALNMNSQQINGLANGVLSTDAATVGQIASTYVPLSGGVTMTGGLTMPALQVNTGASVNAATIYSNGGASGANIRLYDSLNGLAKYIRVLGGTYGIVNNAYSAVVWSVDDSGNSNQNGNINLNGGIGAQGSISCNGNMTAQGNVTAYSDERLKTDWLDMKPSFVEQLAQVRSGTYTRIDNGLRQTGVGAQSLQSMWPEAVVENENGMLSVAYGQAALAACVELAREVVELRKRIAFLGG